MGVVLRLPYSDIQSYLYSISYSLTHYTFVWKNVCAYSGNYNKKDNNNNNNQNDKNGCANYSIVNNTQTLKTKRSIALQFDQNDKGKKSKISLKLWEVQATW